MSSNWAKLQAKLGGGGGNGPGHGGGGGGGGGSSRGGGGGKGGKGGGGGGGKGGGGSGGKGGGGGGGGGGDGGGGKGRGGGGGGRGGGGGGQGAHGGRSLGGWQHKDRPLPADGPQPGLYKKPRLSVPAPRFDASGSVPPLLEPGHAEYEACLRRCYRGFVHEPAPLPSALQQRVQAALVRLNAEGYFHHDVVLGSTKGGTAPVPTIVRRILVGEPGITYKYLGLRIFAHPWRPGGDAGGGGDGEGGGEGGGGSCLDGAAVVGELNTHLQKETARLLAAQQQQQTGSCTYNLTLINLLEEHEARRRLQPRGSQAATPCIPGCNPARLPPRGS